MGIDFENYGIAAGAISITPYLETRVLTRHVNITLSQTHPTMIHNVTYYAIWGELLYSQWLASLWVCVSLL